MFDCHTRVLAVTSLVLVILYAIFLLLSPLGQSTVAYIHKAYVHKDIQDIQDIQVSNREVLVGLLILSLFFVGSGGVLSYTLSHYC